jgi:hypothetical protein
MASALRAVLMTTLLALSMRGDPIIADVLYVPRITAEISGYNAMSPMQKVQALRVYAYKHTPLAAVQKFLIRRDLAAISLQEVYANFDAEKRGVWCGDTAMLLARIYRAAGFEAWVYNFGKKDLLTHVTTLVKVKREIYLQDAYLNFEYLDEAGQPLPFREVVGLIRDGHPPLAATYVTEKLGYFSNSEQVEHWTGEYYHKASCMAEPGGLKCSAPITLERFLEVFYLMDKTYDFLEVEGWPRQVGYLMLYPISLAPYGGSIEFANDMLAQIQAMNDEHRRSGPSPLNNDETKLSTATRSNHSLGADSR